MSVPGDGASGRTGGFCDASVTHGIANGLDKWPQEYPLLHRLGRENLDGLLAALDRHDIDARWELVGELDVATAPWQLDSIEDHVSALRDLGEQVSVLDPGELRAEVDSPSFVGGEWRRSGVGLVDPGRLVFGLRRGLADGGVRLADNTPVTSLRRRDSAAGGTGGTDRTGSVSGTAVGGVELLGPGVKISARQVLLATNAFPGLLAPIRRAVVPVYDHVLVTEPLSSAQRESIGWRNRQGIGDSANQFHYFRLTPDDRILWGGYDAIYHWRGRLGPAVEANEATERMLAAQLLDCFPQIEGIRITHRWGGPIATTTRFAFTAGHRWERRVAWAVGYTGLGVGASRFGARVALDLLAGADNERTRLAMVRRPALRWPPEPIRWAGITITRRAIASADAHDGRRGPWLRLLDRLGVGFDS